MLLGLIHLFKSLLESIKGLEAIHQSTLPKTLIKHVLGTH